ncbi:MAG: hypothetical protein CMK09_12155 [Ponticaulis sp.]|nr:hypothetical protein [Ponticaulis sp.]|tara:strand:+ start:8763 stop:9245 length:483 start_codon:yes stop_codon:yes gene_type:complete
MKTAFTGVLLGATLMLAGAAHAASHEEGHAEEALKVAVSAVGIGVTSLEESSKFYIDTLGMRSVMTYELDYMDEIVLVAPDGGSAIVLMEYTDGIERNVTDLPVKIVYRTSDPTALAEKIKTAGYEIVREPVPSEAVGGAIVGFAKDPDGYLIEILPMAR